MVGKKAGNFGRVGQHPRLGVNRLDFPQLSRETLAVNVVVLNVPNRFVILQFGGFMYDEESPEECRMLFRWRFLHVINRTGSANT